MSELVTYAIDPGADPEAQAIAVAYDAILNLKSTSAQRRVVAYLSDRIEESAFDLTSTLSGPR